MELDARKKKPKSPISQAVKSFNGLMLDVINKLKSSVDEVGSYFLLQEEALSSQEDETEEPKVLSNKPSDNHDVSEPASEKN